MTQVTLWHYPRCSKSRRALSALEAAGIEPKIREYRKQPPTEAEVLELIEQAGGSPAPFVRTKEEAASELSADQLTDPTAVAGAIAKHPELLQRPILVADGRAVIARDPDTLATVIEGL